jgi:hypothetical protein
MDLHRKLVSAIEAFDRWEQPWEFYPSVSFAISIDIEESEEFQRVWATATEDSSWSACEDLAHGCLLADARLSSTFPWLSVAARRQLVNGASYQWR